MVNDVAV